MFADEIKPRELISCREAAKILQCSVRHVYNLIEQRALEVRWISGPAAKKRQREIYRDSLEQFLKEQGY